MNNLALECVKSSDGRILDNLQNEDSINETDYFAIVLHSYTPLPILDLVVLFTDIPFHLEEKYVKGEYVYVLSEYSLRRYFAEENFDYKDYSKEIGGIKMSRLFLNYPVGVSEIVLYDDKQEEVVAEFKINVTSHKLDESEFVSLVNYVETKSVALWDKYSLLKNEASPNTSIDKNDWQLLFIQKFIQELNGNIYSFEYDKLNVYKKEPQLVAYNSDVMVDEESVFWLAQNLDTLSNTNSVDCDKILLQNRLFRPSEMLTNITYANTDIVENQFIHGFVDELIMFFNNCNDEFEKHSNSVINDDFVEMMHFYSQKRKRKLFSDYLNELKNIKAYLVDFIPVTKTVLEYIPNHRIISKDHYQYIYERFIEWFSYDRVKFANNKLYFKGVTRMDRLFERACLYKIIDAFVNWGYKSIVEETLDKLPRKVRFEKANRFLTLHYESYPDNYVTQALGNNLKPDFFIEFDNGKVLIMDAKYKKNSSVKNNDWEKLTLKYLHGIGYKNGETFKPIALLALIPSSNNKTEFYQKSNYGLMSQTPVFPAIGSLVVDFEGRVFDFEKHLQRILKLVTTLN